MEIDSWQSEGKVNEKGKEGERKEGKKMAVNWKLICLEINIDLSIFFWS